MTNEMIKQVAKAAQEKARVMGSFLDDFVAEEVARAAIEAMRELPSEPGPRYTAGEYSRRTQEAMVDDAINALATSGLFPVYGSREVEEK